jgi:Glycosyl transferase family 2
MLPTVKSRACVTAILRNETPFIIEWVAWHRLLGFDVMIADNGSGGRQTELLKKLDAAGIIRRFDVTSISVMPQVPAYHAMFHAALDAGYSYLGLLDAHEFFEPLGDSSWHGAGVRVIQRLFAETKAAAIGFNWMVFGSAGHTESSDDLVTDRFIRAADVSFGPNRVFKSFLDLWKCRIICDGENLCDFLHPQGLKIGDANYSHDGAPMRFGTDVQFGKSASVSWKNARVRHYVVKTKAEFMRDKVARGQADAIVDLRYTNEFFAEYDRNEVSAPIHPGIRSPLKAEIKSMQFDVGVSHAIDDQTANVSFISRAIEQFAEYRIATEKKELASQLATIYGSMSWRILAPIRALVRIIESSRRLLVV